MYGLVDVLATSLDEVVEALGANADITEARRLLRLEG
jgi:hypothetical protein